MHGRWVLIRDLNVEFDVFISHASEDKPDVVRPLVAQLKEMGLHVWLDEFELTLGDSLRRSIDKGLSRSKYGVVILSPDFLRKEWPNKELDGLVSREDGKEKVILPVWHNVDFNDVAQFSPMLADKVAISTSHGVDVVARKVFEAVNRFSGSSSGLETDFKDPTRLKLNRIRRNLISTTGSHELRRLLYEVEEVLHKAPSNTDAKILHDQIHGALNHKPSSSPIQPKTYPSRSSGYRYAIAFAAIATIGLTIIINQEQMLQYIDVDTEDSRNLIGKCRLSEHGVESWGKVEQWEADSGWRKGGSSPNEFCGAKKLEREALYPDREVVLLTFDEKHKSEYMPFKHDYYRYTCIFEDRWKPVYKIAPNRNCP